MLLHRMEKCKSEYSSGFHKAWSKVQNIWSCDAEMRTPLLVSEWDPVFLRLTAGLQTALECPAPSPPTSLLSFGYSAKQGKDWISIELHYPPQQLQWKIGNKSLESRGDAAGPTTRGYRMCKRIFQSLLNAPNTHWAK